MATAPLPQSGAAAALADLAALSAAADRAGERLGGLSRGLRRAAATGPVTRPVRATGIGLAVRIALAAAALLVM